MLYAFPAQGLLVDPMCEAKVYRITKPFLALLTFYSDRITSSNKNRIKAKRRLNLTLDITDKEKSVVKICSGTCWGSPSHRYLCHSTN